MHSSGAYGSTGKEAVGFDDLFTIADVTVQKTIEHNIKQLFPYVNIVSEEDNEHTQHIKPTLEPDQLARDLVSEKMLHTSFRKRRESLKRYLDSEHGLGTLVEEEALNFAQEDMQLWIDPLDGTKSFSNGQTEYVTTLIGVSVHGRPRIGIIHKPYLSADFDLSKTYLGSIETGLFTSEYNQHYTEDDDARLVTRNFQYAEPFAQPPILDAPAYHLHIAATLNRFKAVE